MKNKKGLSAIVATLIIILLAIVAFAIISVVIRNTVTKGAENIELGQKCLEVEMHATKIVYLDGARFNITFSRSISGETIDGIKVVLINADDTDSISHEMGDDVLGDIESQSVFTETITFTNVPENFVPAKVQVVPFFMKKSGELFYCSDNSFTDELTLE